MSNRGRSTAGGPAVPYYTSTPAKEAAKHLRLTVTRYLANRATLADVRAASAILLSAEPGTAYKPTAPDFEAARAAISALPDPMWGYLAEVCRRTPGKCWCGAHRPAATEWVSP